MNVQFVSSFAVISRDMDASQKFFVDTIGLPLNANEGDEYLHSEQVEGVKHFGVWPLSQAAQACFGTREWPDDRTRPQASVEFDVESVDAVAAAAEELQDAGYDLLHPTRTEPWGQTVTRLLSSEGLIVGISYVPSMH
jgi:catechol 2,3-dioxygenase-like lactoylglutathione lyase family enzyme